MNTGNNLLFLIVSALLSFMAITGVFGWMNIRGVQLELFLPDEIYAESPCSLRVRMTNRHRLLPLFLIRVRASGSTTALLPLVLPKESGELLLSESFSARGALQGMTLYAESVFPVNFFLRYRRITLSSRGMVFPRPSPCSGASSGDGQNIGAGISPRGYGGGELVGIDEYTPADPLKQIHWRLSARHDDIRVKRTSSLTAEPVIIDPEALLPSDLEEKLSCAAYLVNLYQRSERPVGLRINGRLIPPLLARRHRLRLLSELAVYARD